MNKREDRPNQAKRIGESRMHLGLTVLSLIASAVFIVACESPEERVAGYIASAQQHISEKDLIKAEVDLKNALQIAPKNPEARLILAEVNESRGEYQDMASNLRIALDADPELAEARIKLGVLYALAGEIKLAEEQADRLSEADRQSVDAKLLLARIAASKGDLNLAKTELQSAVQQEPTNEQALGLLASVSAATDLPGALALIDKGIAQAEDKRALRMLRIQLLRQAGNRQKEVEEQYRALMSDYPEDAQFGYQFAQFLVSEGRVDEIEPVLLKVIESDPDNVEARLALVQFIARAKGVDEAEKLLIEYAKALPDSNEIHLALASLYQQSGENDKAYSEYKMVADRAGKEDQGLNAKASMAAIKLSDGDEKAGEELLEEVLAADSVNAQALTLRAALYLQRSDFRKSVADLREVLRSNPENLQAQLLLARVHNQAGDEVLAEDAYRRALAISPASEVATLELVRILIARSRPDEAREILEKQLEKSPDNLAFARALIGVQLAQELPEDAVAEAKRVAAIPGNEAAGNFLLGNVYQAEGSHEKAITAFQAALKNAPTAAEPLRGMVASMMQLKRTDDARNYLAALEKEYPDNLLIKTLLSQVLASAGNPDAGKEMIESALQSDAEWLPGYTTLAGLQTGDLSAQIGTYRRGLEAMPGSQELVLLLGTAYEKNDQIDEAIAAYEDALKAKPDSPAVANNLASLLADYRTDTDSYRQALELVEQFSTSDNPAFLDTLGWVYYRLGDYENALPLLEKSVEVAPQVPVLRYHLGMAYLALDKKTMAKEQLEKALADKNANFTGIDDARKALAGL